MLYTFLLIVCAHVHHLTCLIKNGKLNCVYIIKVMEGFTF